jgi:hypothetical protein
MCGNVTIRKVRASEFGSRSLDCLSRIKLCYGLLTSIICYFFQKPSRSYKAKFSQVYAPRPVSKTPARSHHRPSHLCRPYTERNVET